jgi:predicted Fe-Mo cluster-binding NifX family protein
MEENNFSFLSAPAQRALANKGIKNLKELATYSQAEILILQGMGPGSIPKLKAALENEGLTFKN